MAQLQSYDLKQRLKALGRFSFRFEQNGFDFGKWAGLDPSATGQITMPHYLFSKDGAAFIDACYEGGWVLHDFDWSSWQNTAEAIGLWRDPDATATATPDQIAKTLTVLIRQERFSDGTLAAAFQSGFLIAILRRAMALAQEQ